MDELLNWLRTQHNGLRTYKLYHQKAVQLAASDRSSAALYQLLASVVSRFIEVYEEHPLTGDVADAALDRLTKVTEKAAASRQAGPAEQLAILNDIAAMDLG